MALVNRVPNRLAVEALDPASSDHVLEVGFGPGKALAALAARVPAGRVCGLDASPAMFRQARRRNGRAIAAGRVGLALGDFDQLPWADRSFDGVLAVNVAYFFGADGAAVSEIRRVLRPGGRAVFFVTDRATMKNWPFAAPDTHATYDADGLLNLLIAGGFASGGVVIEHRRLPFGVDGILAVATAPKDIATQGD
jgi:ubiquinone/menaquinone biosynthesis C-methylase UbiE